MLSIVLNILGLVVIIVATYLVYKTASGNGRNGVLWAFLVVALGVTLQFIVPTIATVIMVYTIISSSSSMPEYMMMDEINWYAWMFTIGGLALSLISIWAIMRYVSRLPEDDPVTNAPPPPPDFGGLQ